MAALFALTAMLVHFALPTGAKSPQQHSARPVDSGGAVVAVVKPGWRLALHSRPNGQSVGVLSSRTVYGGPLTLPVVRSRGDWLGVLTAAMPNGHLGWVRAEPGALTFGRIRLALEADLSRRVLRVWARGHTIRRIRVGIGRPGTSTPTGRFSITDKMPGASLGPYYGCCLLALSGTQPHTPPGWTGGARLAIHGGAYGAVSAGCLHASTADLRYLMRVVPLGTQIVIHA
ncbi:MAG: L,D-transpeptidase [Actinobacteria bacterium]|nr:MAG: L,D-transpeptidase [Actinomycetota bacterium]TMM23174.1 MAG: L,D-transpeptidase [Actinomycetota bacterium]